MPKANRADFTSWLESQGVDSGGGAGLPLAEGLQAVFDIKNASHPERRVFGARVFVGPGGVGLHQELALNCVVPTIIHHLSFDGTNAVPRAPVEIINSADAPAGAPVTTFIQGWATARNGLTTRNTSPVILAGGFELLEAAVPQSPNVDFLTGFPLAGGRHITLQDPTTNSLTFFRIVWEEQTSNRTNPPFI